MLKYLKLTNFRSHENLEVRFTPGLNTLLGRNEAGKSTILESISYAMLGSDMLRESAAEVVTYDKPLNSLRVDLLLEIDGVDYTIYRTPASAEIRYADQIVTGQRATKQFMETLLCCDTTLFKQLVFAAQESVKGVIASDQKGAAGSLVERLADLDLIDSIVNSIQVHLPSGNTKTLAAQLTQLQESAEEAPELPKKEAVETAVQELAWANAQLEKLQPKSAQNTTKIGALKLQLAQAGEARFSKEKALKLQAQLQVQAKLPTISFTEGELQAARELVYGAESAARKRKAYATVFPTHPMEWEGSEESFLREIDDTRTQLTKLELLKRELREQRITVAATAINEDVCSFCKKDISQLPEVELQNAKVENLLESNRLAAMKAEEQLVEATLTLKTLQDIQNITQRIRQLADAEYWSLSDTIPPKPTWIGGEVLEATAVPDVKTMQAQWNKYVADKATAEAAAKQLAELEIPEAPDTTDLQAELDALQVEVADFERVKLARENAHRKLQAAELEHAGAMKVYDYQVKSHEDRAAQIAQLTASISEAEKHNALIKKLRDTRPAIASELWTIVLGGISHYFSKIRGVDSVVTRDNEGFRVNGRSVNGLSGSTQDALGLAVRVALTRTFLPNVPLLVLDEPFHGCDKTRETAGLALLTSTGFEQTLLVTHSDLADSLSDNLLAL